ncbi:transcription factor ABORTED MICROSPORES [Cornus florida]|uniref:transcription factor ABORTED MICROSPORES n=1 Tax=Cornus florida TaxID=4283 RepID=UPI00289CCD53|nr:transcription factor ABORTED MICROSPORES [Cornus florida]
MNIVQYLMERLRPLVGSKSWDYCVIWKLSEDQRFLKWMDCCCSGAENTQNGGEELLFPVSSIVPCRDGVFQHCRTKACDLLAQLPSSVSLGSGIHALTLMSNQPKWLNFYNSDSNVSEESVGTRVLIPLLGGLLELFVAKQVPEDQHFIDFIAAQCNISLEHQVIDNPSQMDTSFPANMNTIINGVQSKPFLADGNDHKDHSNSFQPPVSPATALENLNLPYDISVDRIQLCDSPMNFLQQFNHTSENRAKNDLLFEEMSNYFKPSVEDGSQEMDEMHRQMMNNTDMNAYVMEPLANKVQQGNDKDSVKHETGRSESISDCSDLNDDEDDAKYRRRTGKEPKSKNLMAERKRRKKLNDRLYALRSLVPKISKLDRASILGDAIEFVKELQKQVKDLQHELEDQSDDEGTKNNGTNSNHSNGRLEIVNQNGFHLGPKPEHEKAPNGFLIQTPAGSGVVDSSKQNQDLEIPNEKARQMEPQVEVAQLDGNEFFVKVFCEHKPGGFVRLMEALNSLGLEVTNVNVTSFRCLVSNVFKVEKRDSEMVRADHVRDSLLEITRNPSGVWPEEMVKASENGNDNGMDYHHHHHHHHNHHLHGHQIGSSDGGSSGNMGVRGFDVNLMPPQ